MSTGNDPYFTLKIEDEETEGRRVFAFTVAVQTFQAAMPGGAKFPDSNATLLRRAAAIEAYLADGTVPGSDGGEAVPVPGGSDGLNKIVAFNQGATVVA